MQLLIHLQGRVLLMVLDSNLFALPASTAPKSITINSEDTNQNPIRRETFENRLMPSEGLAVKMRTGLGTQLPAGPNRCRLARLSLAVLERETSCY